MIEIQDRCGNKLFRIERLPVYLNDEIWRCFDKWVIMGRWYEVINDNLLKEIPYERSLDDNNQMGEEWPDGYSLNAI